MYRQFVYVKNDVFICCFKSISAVILMQQIYLSPLVMCVVNLHLEIRNATNDLQVVLRVEILVEFCKGMVEWLRIKRTSEEVIFESMPRLYT